MFMFYISLSTSTYFLFCADRKLPSFPTHPIFEILESWSLHTYRSAVAYFPPGLHLGTWSLMLEGSVLPVGGIALNPEAALGKNLPWATKVQGWGLES